MIPRSSFVFKCPLMSFCYSLMRINDCVKADFNVLV